MGRCLAVRHLTFLDNEVADIEQNCWPCSGEDDMVVQSKNGIAGEVPVGGRLAARLDFARSLDGYPDASVGLADLAGMRSGVDVHISLP